MTRDYLKVHILKSPVKKDEIYYPQVVPSAEKQDTVLKRIDQLLDPGVLD